MLSLATARAKIPEWKARRDRLRNPPNAVRDTGVDLKRKPKRIVTAPPQIAPDPPKPFVPPLGIGRLVPEYVLLYGRQALSVYPVTVREIQAAVCREYEITRCDILSRRRTRNVVLPRHIAMWLARKLTRLSLPQIGKQFDSRDHTTIIHSVDKIERARLADKLFAALLDDIAERIRPGVLTVT